MGSLEDTWLDQVSVQVWVGPLFLDFMVVTGLNYKPNGVHENYYFIGGSYVTVSWIGFILFLRISFVVSLGILEF